MHDSTREERRQDLRSERDDARELARWLFYNAITPEEKIDQAAARPWLSVGRDPAHHEQARSAPSHGKTGVGEPR